MRTSRRWGLHVALGVIGMCLLPQSAGLAAPAAAPAEKPAAELRAEIETFQLLHRTRMTGPQAAALGQATKPLQDMLAKRNAQENAPAVIKVLLEFRAAALAGKPITDEMWSRLARAQIEAGGEAPPKRTEAAPEPEEAVDDDPLWQLARQIATTFVQGLGEQQLVGFAYSDAGKLATDLLTDALSKARAPEAEWTEWLDGAVEELLGAQEELPADTDAKLRAFFGKVHKLTPDEARTQSSALTGELAGLVTPKPGKEELQKQAAQRLGEDLLFNQHFIPCLAEYAAAVGGR